VRLALKVVMENDKNFMDVILLYKEITVFGEDWKHMSFL
jgi:hypothetical protein